MAKDFRIVLHDVIYLEADGLQDAVGLAVQSASDYAKELGETVTATVWRTSGVLVGTSVGRPDGMAGWITVEDHARGPAEQVDHGAQLADALRDAVVRTSGLSYGQHGHVMGWHLTAEGPMLTATQVSGRKARRTLAWLSLGQAVDPGAMLRATEQSVLLELLK